MTVVTPLRADMPPADLEAEEAVLATVLLADTALYAIAVEEGLRPEHFYRDDHRLIFAGMLALHDAGDPVDVLTLARELEVRGQLEAAGGRVALDALAVAAPGAGHYRKYARLVRDQAHERDVRTLAWKLAANPADTDVIAELGRLAVDPTHRHAHRRLDVERLVAESESTVPWRIVDLAADAHLTLLAGVGGEGKSLLAGALASGVLRGTTIAGLECRKGTVAILDAENGPRIIGARLRALGVPTEGLSVYDADGLDVVADRPWIEDQLAGVNLAIIDSLRTVATGAEENSSDDMARVVGALRSIARNTGAALIVPHHRGRAELSDYRGSSAIRDQTDLLFAFGREAKDPDAKHRRYLRAVKCRIAEEPETRWLAIKAWRGEITLREAAPFNDRPATPAQDELADDIIRIVSETGTMRRPDLARALGRDPTDGTIRRTLDRLVTGGQIVLTGEGYGPANNHAGSPGSPGSTTLPRPQSFKGAGGRPAGTPANPLGEVSA